jgi:hypothetical protein
MLDLSLSDVVFRHGRLEYDPATGKSGRQRVLEAMCRCDVLILMHGEGMVCHEYIPSKFYEYLLTGRPILALVSRNSELETVIKRENHVAVEMNDKRQVSAALMNLIDQWQVGELPKYDRESPFSVESTVKELIRIGQGLS